MFRFKMFSVNIILLMVILFLPNCAKKEGIPNKNQKLKFEEYKTKIAKSFEKNDKEIAMLYLEKIIEHYPERVDVENYRLALADLYYEMGKKNFDNEYLSRAGRLYKRFCKLNPSDSRTEYASYQMIRCQLDQANKIDCDCSSYEKTLKLCKKHLEKPFFKNGKFVKDIKDIKYTCERLLIDKEVYVFNHSIRNNQLNTAKSRIQYLEETYLPTHPDLVPRIAYMHCKLALETKDKVSAEDKLRFLQDKFKESEFTKMAQNLIIRKDIENRIFL